MTIVKCKDYFNIKELVDPATYEARGERAWQLIDSRILETIVLLREKFGPATINDWSWGGDRKWSGLRTVESPYYSKYSQHSFGRAVDMLFKNHTAEEVRKYILDNPTKFKYVTGVELGITWLHIDVRNADQFYTFYP